MAALLEIAQIGQEVLTTPAQPVIEFDSPDLERLIDDMLLTVANSNGVGLAAPQVFQSTRVIIVSSHPNARYPSAPNMLPTVMINPIILTCSTEKELGWEGCLSVPGRRGQVERHKSLKLEYCDKTGTKLIEEFEGFVARIIQHEIDHLDGISFLERVSSSSAIVSEKEYQKICDS